MLSHIENTSHHDTIFAPSTAAGRSAISVVRISGPSCDDILRAIAPGPLPADRVATLRRLKDSEGDLLDRGLVVRFYAPRSFTGEEMVELHVTGGRGVISGVLETLGAMAGLRPAEPGEFAWRAFQNGKLDLSEIEGLGELVAAETAAQRRQALRVTEGQLSRSADAIRAMILKAMSLIEAEIDFSDAEDVVGQSKLAVHEIVRSALKIVRAILDGATVAERLRHGLTVVIAGAPNAGKSTLINVLSKRDVAIVSEIPGTTRDTLEVALDLDGYPVRIIDTAGIRDSVDPIERIGVQRARNAIDKADVILWLYEGKRSSSTSWQGGGEIIWVRTKSDLELLEYSEDDNSDAVSISAKTGDGLARLLARIAGIARSHFSEADTSLLVTERQTGAFTATEEALCRILEEDSDEIEFLAEDLRLAARSVGRISGRVGVEDVLSDIFSRLCIGK